MPVQVGLYNTLKVARKAGPGVYLDDGGEGILLPARQVPDGAKTGDELRVFIYHDSDNRLIATTMVPKAVVGDLARLTVVSVTPQGAFLDWGLAKDLFVPKSQMATFMRLGGEYLVRLYIDKQTGRVAATERLESFLSNEELTVTEGEEVSLTVFRRTDLGFAVIINGKHLGLLYDNEVYQDLAPGDTLTGFIRTIRPDNKIDVVAGKKGYARVEGEAGRILELLADNGGYLPFNDKSDPEAIYQTFGMSKKTFKMTTGALYKQQKIIFTKTGIQLLDTVGD
jgi:predicted RNA-binding protein (virulence factor B family)